MSECTVENPGTDPVIIAKAQNICEKFTQLHYLYSDIHSRISHQRPISQEEVPAAEKCI